MEISNKLIILIIISITIVIIFSSNNFINKEEETNKIDLTIVSKDIVIDELLNNETLLYYCNIWCESPQYGDILTDLHKTYNKFSIFNQNGSYTSTLYIPEVYRISYRFKENDFIESPMIMQIIVLFENQKPIRIDFIFPDPFSYLGFKVISNENVSLLKKNSTIISEVVSIDKSKSFKVDVKNYQVELISFKDDVILYPESHSLKNDYFWKVEYDIFHINKQGIVQDFKGYDYFNATDNSFIGGMISIKPTL